MRLRKEEIDYVAWRIVRKLKESGEMLLTGSEDANSTPAMSSRMARFAPHGHSVVVDGAGHMAQMTHPGEVTGALRAHLVDVHHEAH